MSLPDQWKNYLSVYLKIKEKTAQISSQKMQQPGCERQDLKAVVGQSSCLAALQPLPKTGAPTWSPPSSPPQTEQGELPQGLDPELPGCQGRWRRSRGVPVPCPPAPWSGCAACPAACAGPPRFWGAAWCHCPAAPQKPGTGREGWRRVKEQHKTFSSGSASLTLVLGPVLRGINHWTLPFLSIES